MGGIDSLGAVLAATALILISPSQVLQNETEPPGGKREAKQALVQSDHKPFRLTPHRLHLLEAKLAEAAPGSSFISAYDGSNLEEQFANISDVFQKANSEAFEWTIRVFIDEDHGICHYPDPCKLDKSAVLFPWDGKHFLVVRRTALPETNFDNPKLRKRPGRETMLSKLADVQEALSNPDKRESKETVAKFKQFLVGAIRLENELRQARLEKDERETKSEKEARMKSFEKEIRELPDNLQVICGFVQKCFCPEIPEHTEVVGEVLRKEKVEISAGVWECYFVVEKHPEDETRKIRSFYNLANKIKKGLLIGGIAY